MRFALIGLGDAARTLHAPAIRSIPGASIAGGADPSPHARKAWTRLAGGPVFVDAEELLETARPDVVVVATPPDSHAAHCLRALAAGVHVICEKPLATSLEEADAVLEAARRAGRQVALNMEFREMPVFARLPPLIGSPDVGRLVFVQIWQLMPPAHMPGSDSWRASMADRTLLEAGVHLVDLLLMLFGELPEAVYARTSAGPESVAHADPIHLATFEFARGRLAQLTMDRLCPAGVRYLEMRADCERASLRASLGGRALVRLGLKRGERAGARVELGLGGLSWMERGSARVPLARNPRDPRAAATASLFRRIAAAFREGGEPPTPAGAGRDALACVLACYRSARTGARVEVCPAAERQARPPGG